MNFINSALDYFFPPICGMCGEINENYICNNCYENIKKIKKCVINEYNNRNFSKHLYIFRYEGIIRNKIIEYKFEDKGYLYKMFAKIILSDKKTCNFIKRYDVIIPVPISKKRKKKRGYNQSELVANELAQKLNQDIWTDIIIKKKDNKPQSELNKLERIKNVEDIYEINKPIEVKNKKVLLLDDIYTTGSTVNEIARKLKQNQTQEIGVITLAKD
ncbi:MAG TPA: ComF family protein [Clostridiaceae bacterium]|jgi:phosphoribosyltransferase|nr:ComF family protein [Clostridiaceae bacterium]